MNTAEDYADVGGLALQRDTGGGSSSDDEGCLMSRDSTDAAVVNTRLKADGGPMTVTAAKTGAYTAAAGEIVRVDPSGGTFTVTFPASPTGGDQVGVWCDQDDTTSITIGGNGNVVEYPWTAARTISSFLWAGAGRCDVWRYDGTDWRLA